MQLPRFETEERVKKNHKKSFELGQVRFVKKRTWKSFAKARRREEQRGGKEDGDGWRSWWMDVSRKKRQRMGSRSSGEEASLQGKNAKRTSVSIFGKTEVKKWVVILPPRPPSNRHQSQRRASFGERAKERKKEREISRMHEDSSTLRGNDSWGESIRKKNTEEMGIHLHKQNQKPKTNLISPRLFAGCVWMWMQLCVASPYPGWILMCGPLDRGVIQCVVRREECVVCSENRNLKLAPREASPSLSRPWTDSKSAQIIFGGKCATE
jgi:hypothetical protein